jgi:hypothetical protein
VFLVINDHEHLPRCALVHFSFERRALQNLPPETDQAAWPGWLDMGGDPGRQRALDADWGVSPSKGGDRGSKGGTATLRGISTAITEARDAAPKIILEGAHEEIGVSPQSSETCSGSMSDASSDDPWSDASSDDPWHEASSDDPWPGACSDDPWHEASSDNPWPGASSDDPWHESSSDNPWPGASSDNPRSPVRSLQRRSPVQSLQRRSPVRSLQRRLAVRSLQRQSAVRSLRRRSTVRFHGSGGSLKRSGVCVSTKRRCPPGPSPIGSGVFRGGGYCHALTLESVFYSLFG